MSTDAPAYLQLETADLFFCLVGARYNQDLVDQLLDSAQSTLALAGVPEANISVMRVPGSNELPYATYMQAMSGQYDVVIALGVVVAGDTSHHEIIAESTADAFHFISMRTEVPVINGILTTNTREQAEQRVGPPHNRGTEFANAAIEMARHKVALTTRLDEIEEARHQQEPDDSMENN